VCSCTSRRANISCIGAPTTSRLAVSSTTLPQ
jgi:hypothetical protein